MGGLGDDPRVRLEVDTQESGPRPGGHAKRQMAPYPPDPAGSGQAEPPRHPRAPGSKPQAGNHKDRRATFGTWGDSEFGEGF